jgi:hypothetical protein
MVFFYYSWSTLFTKIGVLLRFELKFNLKAYLSTAALPGQTTKTAQKAETRTPKRFLMQDWVFRLGKTVILFSRDPAGDNWSKLEHMQTT